MDILTTVEGVYKEGEVTLSEVPAGITEARVIVAFLTPNGPTQAQAESQAAPQYLRFGQRPGLQQTTEEDSRMAEWGDDKIPEEFR